MRQCAARARGLGHAPGRLRAGARFLRCWPTSATTTLSACSASWRRSATWCWSCRVRSTPSTTTSVRRSLEVRGLRVIAGVFARCRSPHGAQEGRALLLPARAACASRRRSF
jgi:hypothetical protein